MEHSRAAEQVDAPTPRRDGGRVRILVGHDGSANANTALAVTAALFPASDVTVLHVSKSIFDWGLGQHAWMLDKDEYDQAVLDAAQRALDAAILHARTLGLSATGALRTTAGSAWRAILDVAGEDPPDLIVVGRHNRGRLGGMRLGSISHGLASHSSHPTLVVPPTTALTSESVAESPIVVGFDDSPGARHALELVARLQPGAPTVIASIWETIPAWLLRPPPVPATLGDDVVSDLAAIARDRADAGVELAHAEGLAAEPLTAMGADGVWPELVALAERRHARLLCVGARTHGRIAAAVLGSVAHAVVSESTVPVLLAHPAVDADITPPIVKADAGVDSPA